MKSPLVLAYAGGMHASAAIPWLIEAHGVDIVTVTLDVGQGDGLSELRARALACGAARAHVIDCRDEFARDVLLPSLYEPSMSEDVAVSIAVLPRPLIARRLAEVARIEGTRTVAHGSRARAFDEAIHAVDAGLRIIAPARAWSTSTADLTTYVRAHHLPVQSMPTDCRIDQNLWGRVVTWDQADEPPAARAHERARRLSEPALVDIHFESGVPTSVNGVPMSAVELIDCLSLIGSQHGIGHVRATHDGEHGVCDMPAAVVLRAAAAAAGGRVTTDVCLKLGDGRYDVLTSGDRHSLLVNYA